MKVQLMFPDRDFDAEAPRIPLAADLTADLGLDVLLDAMAASDPLVGELCKAALLQPLTDVNVICYRQQVLTDLLYHPQLAQRLFDLAGEGLEANRHIHFGIFHDRPGPKLRRARECLVAFFAVLRKIRAEIDTHATEVTAPGLTTLCQTLHAELSEDYLDTVDRYLRILAFPRGTLQSARLGSANQGTRQVLRSNPPAGGLQRLLPSIDWGRHTVTVPDRDIAGMEELTDLQDQALAAPADSLAAAVDHVLCFFQALRREFGFYLGAIHLHQALTGAGQAVTIPEPVANGNTVQAAGLYEPLLVLRGQRHPVPNDVDAGTSGLLVITGANQGGKSTLLRALGLAQLMLQAGLFVPAQSMRASVVTGIHTHFKRAEDDTLTSGKLDEELRRLSTIVDHLQPGGLLLCNESLSSTNEREAAAIGARILRAFLAAGVRVNLVTHLYELAARLEQEVPGGSFLRVTRLPDGTRTYRVQPGSPHPTSHAADLYQQVFDQPLIASEATQAPR